MSVHTETTQLQGKRIGSYRLTHPLGHGGSAHVFLGTHVQLGRHVAVKVVRRPCSDAALKQLWNEARILPRLQHPHIVRGLDFYNDETYSLLVMEYALHGTLRQRYPVGSRLQLPAIVHYVQQVAAALHYTHMLGYIHRDVKPENLLLNQDGFVLLSDFGIATTSYYADRLHDKFGTAPYTAPEQAHGRPCAASDQYSLAVLVYEWLCGHPPFAGTMQEVLQQHRTTPPPSLASQGRAVPQAVEMVVQKALAKNPLQRFESIQRFSYMLSWAIQQPMRSAQMQVPRQSQVPSSAVGPHTAAHGPHTGRTIFSHPVTQAYGQTGRQRTMPHISSRRVVAP